MIKLFVSGRTNRSFRKVKGVAALIFFLALLPASRFTVFAQDIKFVRISEEQEVSVGSASVDSVRFSASRGAQYSIAACEILNTDSYGLGDPLEVRIILAAWEGCSFVDIKPSFCLIEGKAANTAEILGDGSGLELYFELPALHARIEAPMYPSLNEDGIAEWTGCEGADRYKVKVQRLNSSGAREFVSSVTVSENRADISGIIFSNPGDYVYSVTAESDKYYLDDSEECLLPIKESRLITEDEVGYSMDILNADRGTVYMGGELVTDTELLIEGNYYYFGEDGKWLTGWLEKDDGWRYYDPVTHKRVKDLVDIDGATFYFDRQTGIMRTGFVDTSWGELFFGEDGRRQTGWVRHGSDIYYMLPEGKRYTGVLIDDNNKPYIFRKDGTLVK